MTRYTPFSERIGASAPPMLQIRSMSARLKNSIWNLIGETLPPYYADEAKAVQFITIGFLKKPVERIGSATRHWLLGQYEKLEWYEVYNLLEFVAGNAANISIGRVLSARAVEIANHILEAETSGYRFINGQLAPITSEAENQAIQEALAASQKAGLGAVHEHLRAALTALGRRPEPESRNAVKEAILAVEAAAKLISGEHGGGLDGPLTALAEKAGIDAAMKRAFLSLYGFTSGPSGIRHALLEQANVGFPEAKFMVVACSGFAYFLIMKAEAAGLLKSG